MNAMTELARAISGKAPEARASEHNATVVRRDADGTYWVSIPGGADETPVTTALSDASEGDTVRVAIARGRSVMTGNVTSPSATGRAVSNVGALANRAITVAYQERARIDQLETSMLTAESAVIADLQADAAKVHDLAANELAASTAYIAALSAGNVTAANLAAASSYIGSLAADAVTAQELSAAAAYVVALDAASVTADDIAADHAAVRQLDVHSLLAGFADIRLANVDAMEVGTAKIVELLANSGVFSDLVFSDGHVTGRLDAVTVNGDLINANTIKASRIIFQGTDPETGEQTGLWYALNAQGNSSRPEAEQLDLDDPAYRSALDGSHIVAKSVTANEIDTDSLVAYSAFIDALNAAVLKASTVQIGQDNGAHITAVGDRLSFYSPDGTEVGYVAVEDNESLFYMTKAVVMKDLRFGNWKWNDRPNGNLSLKWIGGAE